MEGDFLEFPKFSEMYLTSWSCISELSEYFLMGPVPLQRSMYKLSSKPNTTENGHLAQKLQSIQILKISRKSAFTSPFMGNIAVAVVRVCKKPQKNNIFLQPISGFDAHLLGARAFSLTFGTLVYPCACARCIPSYSSDNTV